MKNKQNISWILLATALASVNNYANKEKILLAADAINCALPTNDEFESSIKFLIEKSLICRIDHENFILLKMGKN